MLEQRELGDASLADLLERLARGHILPVGGVPSHASHRWRGHAARQEPEEMPRASLDGIVAAALPRIEVDVSEVGLEMDVSWHATVLHHSATTRSDPPLEEDLRDLVMLCRTRVL